ncbi:hypothetical protein Clacol_009780 [Clathrus columnatus]|uniref:Protein kinase domain-containing protein n=1 Tax=Clathrus columnatus TaxID=1419009 RepID=A0AAV5ANX4_9AGAM|nr:hypothetical protein Clacol_009780 [Clathrus columnatus]
MSSPRKVSSSAQSYAGDPRKGGYSTESVRTIIKEELEGKLEFDRPNVLHRLGIQDVDDELVNRIGHDLENDESFVESKMMLNKLFNLSGNDGENATGEKKNLEDKMMEPLSQIFDRVVQLAVADDNGRGRRYERKWLANADQPLQGEGDTFSFSEIKPDFTLCDEFREIISGKGKKRYEVLWRHRAAFIELKATSAQGPKPVKQGNTVKAIVSQAADYARLHLTCRPFQLFSIGLLIFGKQFCVAIFDKDGVQFSPIHDLWDNLDVLIRIIRRMTHEMSPVDFGQDPNVNILPNNHPNSVTCRNIATALAKGNTDLINEITNYPTYSINFCNIKYYTIGLPVWTSLSLLGRGTSIWRVSASPTESFATGIFLILKTAWRQSKRPSESAIMQRIKGSHDGLVQYSQGSDVFFPSFSLIAPPKITTANLRNQNRHVEGDTTILHRLIFKTVGRPIWEFDSYLEFFLAIKAALNAHKFLADQNILHRDISAGNVLLSSNPNAPDSQKGFLTDLEFARIDDGTLETKNIIPVPSLFNPNRVREMTVPTTRTHTTWTPPPRGAVLTLHGKLQFDRTNVLSRLCIQDVDDVVVRQCQNRLNMDEIFLKSKSKLDRLHMPEEKLEEDSDSNEANKKERERQLTEQLENVFNRICQFTTETKTRQYNRRWVSTAAKKLRGEKNTPTNKSSLILCEEYKDIPSKKRRKELEILWRHRMSFVKLKPTAAQGPKSTEEDTVTEIVAEAAEYARAHLSLPFQLFSIGLFIFGKQFCVAIFDKDGVQFSSIHDLWDNLDVLIRIIRRMTHEMSPVDFGQDPNVNILPNNHPNSVTCRNIATALAKGNTDLINEITNYPTYSINFCNIKYYTIGLPVWTSLSLLGRGTSIWRVSASPTESFATGIFLILKTAWRQSKRPSESAIMQRIKGSHDGLVQYSQGSDVFFPSSSHISPPKVTTANLRNQNRHVEGDTTILHRLIFKTVGRPIWEFDSYLEFFLAIKAALNAHKFLADQNILHRDISAGNVLLSSNPNAPDSQKGFLTDLEFARIDDGTLETKSIIPVSSLFNPNRVREMTVPTTRTHTTWTPPPRGAVLTGTIQFMALELVRSLSGGSQPIHRIYHDVESFIWVTYYGILRRIGYVGRNLTGEAISAGLRNISRGAFKELFNHVDPKRIIKERLLPIPSILFNDQETLWPFPIQQFFRDVRRLVHTMRGEESGYGRIMHEELLVVLDKVIASLRQTS